MKQNFKVLPEVLETAKFDYVITVSQIFDFNLTSVRLIKKITFKDDVLGESFSIKERKISTQGRCFTNLKYKLKIT